MVLFKVAFHGSLRSERILLLTKFLPFLIKINPRPYSLCLLIVGVLRS